MWVTPHLEAGNVGLGGVQSWTVWGAEGVRKKDGDFALADVGMK